MTPLPALQTPIPSAGQAQNPDPSGSPGPQPSSQDSSPKPPSARLPEMSEGMDAQSALGGTDRGDSRQSDSRVVLGGHPDTDEVRPDQIDGQRRRGQ